MAKQKIDDEQAEAKPERDTRPVVRPAQVLSAITAAAEAMRVPLTPSNVPGASPRWGVHEAWGRLRAAYHVLPDPVRREFIVRLLLEETDQRVAHDESATLQPSATSSRRRDH